MKKRIIHVSEVDISPNTGMGRVEWHWKKAFEERGYEFLHVGPDEVGPCRHPGLFPFKAKKYVAGLNFQPAAYLVHEPAAGLFTRTGIPCFVESHGVEQRYWELWNSGIIQGLPLPTFKTSLLYPLWRLRGANNGLKWADGLLLLNNEDKNFVQKRWDRKEKDIFVFDNGMDKFEYPMSPTKSLIPTILFNASWLPRKGIHTLINALQLVSDQGIRFKLLLIGLGKHISETEVAQHFHFVKEKEIVLSFDRKAERGYLERSNIFVLPSYYEGKPLSLLQAMAEGLCCITTNTCGQKDIVTHRQNGLLFEPGDTIGFANLLMEAIRDIHMAHKLGTQASIDVKAHSWEKVSTSVVDYVESRLLDLEKIII